MRKADARTQIENYFSSHIFVAKYFTLQGRSRDANSDETGERWGL